MEARHLQGCLGAHTGELPHGGCMLGSTRHVAQGSMHALEAFQTPPHESHGVVQMLVAGWRALHLVSRGEFVGIMGFASMDWLVSDIATTYVGGVMAPLPTNILVEDIEHLILEAEVRRVPVEHTRRPVPFLSSSGLTCRQASSMPRHLRC